MARDLALIDAHGVILDRPEGEDLHFPIVTGLSENMPREEREKRMQTYQEFMKARGSGASPAPPTASAKWILRIRSDLRVVHDRTWQPATDAQAVTVHFGQSDFTGKYRMLVENFAQWQANAGRVQSMDLQYSRQVVVNPDTSTSSAEAKTRSERVPGGSGGLAKKDKYIVGLDIGSTKTCALIAEMDDDR